MQAGVLLYGVVIGLGADNMVKGMADKLRVPFMEVVPPKKVKRLRRHGTSAGKRRFVHLALLRELIVPCPLSVYTFVVQVTTDIQFYSS